MQCSRVAFYEESSTLMVSTLTVILVIKSVIIQRERDQILLEHRHKETLLMARQHANRCSCLSVLPT